MKNKQLHTIICLFFTIGIINFTGFAMQQGFKSAEESKAAINALDDSEDAFMANPTDATLREYKKQIDNIKNNFSQEIQYPHLDDKYTAAQGLLAHKKGMPIPAEAQRLIQEDIDDAQEDLQKSADTSQPIKDRWEALTADAYETLDVALRIHQNIREDLITREIALAREYTQTPDADMQDIKQSLEDDLELIKTFPISANLATRLQQLFDELSGKKPKAPKQTPQQAQPKAAAAKKAAAPMPLQKALTNLQAQLEALSSTLK